jgi:hypothetical protein
MITEKEIENSAVGKFSLDALDDVKKGFGVGCSSRYAPISDVPSTFSSSSLAA